VPFILEIQRLKLELEKKSKEGSLSNEEKTRNSWFNPDDEAPLI